MPEPKSQTDTGGDRRGCANLAIAVSAIIWSLIFLRAATHYSDIAALGYSGAWDFWVYMPLGTAVGLLLGALVFNFAFRSAGALILLSATALLAVLPYLVMTSGGV